MKVNVLKRIRIILLAMWVTSLPLVGMQASAILASPILQSPSPSHIYMTEDSTPTLIFQAAQGHQIQILEGTQIVGSGDGRGEHLVAITITVPLTSGLHQLTYRSVIVSTSESSLSSSMNLIADSSPFDISDIVPLTSLLSASSVQDLLQRISTCTSDCPRGRPKLFMVYNHS